MIQSIYIPNGELVIIIKSSKAFKSIRFKLLFTYLFVGIIPLIIFICALISEVENHYLAQETNKVRTKANQLTTQLSVSNYIQIYKSENSPNNTPNQVTEESSNEDNMKNKDILPNQPEVLPKDEEKTAIVDNEVYTDLKASLEEQNVKIEQLSAELGGRIFIIDKNNVVIKDTTNLSEGKPFINEDIKRGKKGENFAIQNKELKVIQAISPIKSLKNPDSDVKSDVIGVVLINASTQDIYNSISEITNKALLVFIISLIVIIGISFYYSGMITKPFKTLLHAIKEISEGHFDDTIDVKGHLEIEEISVAFNHMTKQLQEIEQSRQEFVSNVSHELKTPLTSIKVLADSLLTQKDLPIELYQEFLQDINHEIEREDKIINDLLSLVKMDKKEAVINIEDSNINELIESILKRLKPISKTRNIDLIYDSNRDIVAQIDEVKLSLAITNLIENAIKYNLDDGWVKISLDADHKFFYLKVIDSGVGIPKDEQEKIFERFYRVDKARSRDTGGTGLGLAITRNIILMHKGFINVQSKLGEGTTFTVRIPLYYNY